MAEKLENVEIKDIIESEGLSYAVQYYLGADNIKDKELAQLWEEAKIVLDKIEALLEE